MIVRAPQFRPIAGLAAALLAAGLVAGCTESASGERSGDDRPRVTLVTDESWELPRELRAAFERQNDLRLVHRKAGRNSGELVAELKAHKGRPFGDVVLGIDTSTAPSALATGTLLPYTSPEANKGPQRFSVDKRQRLSAVDQLTVCVNVDEDWFAEHDLEPPQALNDLADAAYADLTVLPDPEGSGEGLAFLLGTVERFGESGARSYWKRVKANGARVVGSAEEIDEAYTGASKDGDRPIAVALATKPGVLAEDDRTTSVLPQTCHQQVRYAGVLEEASNHQRAGLLLDFLLTQQFQQAVPEAFGTYPVRKRVELPDGWADVAAQPEETTTLPAPEADAGRERWIAQWRAVMG